MATAFVRPVTGTSVDESDVEPSPSRPLLPFPQHQAVPSDATAQLCASPAEMATALVRPVTGTGVDESDVSPLPSWPLRPDPQHQAVPSDATAQL